MSLFIFPALAVVPRLAFFSFALNRTHLLVVVFDPLIPPVAGAWSDQICDYSMLILTTVL